MAARLERRLAVQILRGERMPGSQLPSVRNLAREFGVTAPTIQRVVDRLAATGLVSVRRGSGITVNDPETCGELTLLPLWFEALADQPERTATMLRDFLELRRVVAVHLMRTRRTRIVRAVTALADAAHALATEAGDVWAIAEADLAFTRTVLEASQQFAANALFHTTEALVRDVPGLAEALYGDRSYHRRVIASVASLLAASDGPDGNGERKALAIERILRAWDARTVERFREICVAAPHCAGS